MIKIAHTIELPAKIRAGGRPEKYPWKDMEIGDSFECHSMHSGVVGANKKYYPKRFSVRKYKDGYRCWRVK